MRRAIVVGTVLGALLAALLFFADRALHYRGILEEQERAAIFRGAWVRDPAALQRAIPGPDVFLGDSLFEGWNLGAAFGERAVNLGKNGDKAAQVRARTGDALRLRPRRVILHAGMNDLDGPAARGEDTAPVAARVAAELRAAALEVRDAGSTPVLTTLLPVCRRFALAHLGALPLPTSGRSELAGAAAATSVALRTLAAELGIAIVDLERALAGPDGVRPREWSLPDGIHLNRAGYARAAEALGRALPDLGR